MTTHLSAAHQATYDTIFQHPISRNLEWRNVRSMLEAVSDRAEDHDQHVKFTRNGQTLVIHPPKRKDFSDVKVVMDVRHYLERSAAPVIAAAAEGTDVLVVIDHRSARVYRTELHGAVPQRVVPFNREGTGRHLHYVEDDASGQRKPEQRSFYDAIAKTLEDAQRVVIFGSATRASSAMEQLVDELGQHHAGIARHVVHAEAVDARHLTEDQLLAKARGVYAELAASPGDKVSLRHEAAD